MNKKSILAWTFTRQRSQLPSWTSQTADPWNASWRRKQRTILGFLDGLRGSLAVTF